MSLLPLFDLIALVLTGAVAGLLAGLLGIGGGAVIVPALLLIYAHMGAEQGVIAHQAVATSLASVVATGATSAWVHHRRGAVDWPLFLRLVPGLLVGAWCGAYAAGWMPGDVLQRLFGLFLLFSSARMLIGAPPATPRPLPGAAGLAGFGTLVGALSALLGIGGGILVVPFLARRGPGMRRAVATSSACGVPLALVGSVGFVLGGWGREGLLAHSAGFVYWPGVLAIVLASVPMAVLGARLAHGLPTRTLKRVFGALLAVVGIELLAG